jgi:hypothetical protein
MPMATITDFKQHHGKFRADFSHGTKNFKLVVHFDEPVIQCDYGEHHRYKLEVRRKESVEAHWVRAYGNPFISWLDESTVLPWLRGDDSVRHIGLQEWLDGCDRAYFDALNAHFDELLNQD